jgi:hypothetical protein
MAMAQTYSKVAALDPFRAFAPDFCTAQPFEIWVASLRFEILLDFCKSKRSRAAKLSSEDSYKPRPTRSAAPVVEAVVRGLSCATICCAVSDTEAL